MQDNTVIIQDNVQDGGLNIQDLVTLCAVFRLYSAGIPRDIVFEQGMSVLSRG